MFSKRLGVNRVAHPVLAHWIKLLLLSKPTPRSGARKSSGGEGFHSRQIVLAWLGRYGSMSRTGSATQLRAKLPSTQISKLES